MKSSINLLLLSLTILLVSCGGGGSESDPTPIVEVVEPTVPEVPIEPCDTCNGISIIDMSISGEDRIEDIIITATDDYIIVGNCDADNLTQTAFVTTVSNSGIGGSTCDSGTGDVVIDDLHKTIKGTLLSNNSIVVVNGHDGLEYGLNASNYSSDGTLNSSEIIPVEDIDVNADTTSPIEILQQGSKYIVLAETITSGHERYQLARFDSSGDPDTTFGVDANGSIPLSSDFSISSDGTVEDVALQDDGKIVVVGEEASKTVIVRYDADGFRDTTFGTNSVLEYNMVGVDNVEAVSVDSNNNIYVVGYRQFNDISTLVVLKINSTGSTVTDIGGLDNYKGYTVDVQSDNRIMVGTLKENVEDSPSPAMIRYNTNGTVNRTTILSDIKVSSEDARNIVTALHSNDKVVLGGKAINEITDDSFLVRFNSDGTLDTETFGK